MSKATNAFVESNQDRFLEELKTFLRIPSISTLPEHASDIQRAAEFVADSLRNAGLENVEIIQTAGHPLVYADWLHAPGKPTVLCYGHYDVQPPDPLELWTTPPFEPDVRDGNLYARGSSDDKGQMYMHVKAMEALRAVNGTLPVNVKFLIEGEEEVGGESVAKYVAENPAKLKSRRRAGVRHGALRGRHSDPVHRPARAGLHRNRSARSGARSAFRLIRRRGAERRVWIDRAAFEIERPERTRS